MKTTEELMVEHQAINPEYIGSPVAPLPQHPEEHTTYETWEKWEDEQAKNMEWVKIELMRG